MSTQNLMPFASFKSLTAPGFFDFSETQTPTTQKIIAWFDAVSAIVQNQTNLYDAIFRQWESKDYSGITISRTPYLENLLTQYGLRWFLGSNTQAAALLSFLSSGFGDNDALNFQAFFNFISAPPLSWIDNSSNPFQIVSGSKIPTKPAEVFILFSSSVSTPPTPPNVLYAPRAWTAPSGWSLNPSSSSYVSRGYLVGTNIVWTTPQNTATQPQFFLVASLATLPPSPPAFSLASVLSDGSGDVGAIYFYDGAVWQKNSSPNVNQGGLPFLIGAPLPRAVAAPDPASVSYPVSSDIAPPATGGSQGYGMYAGLSPQIISSSIFIVSILFTASGFQNLASVINVLRRIKPTLFRLTIAYTVSGSPNPPTQIEIFDSGELR